eukprot:Gb_19815 [translate_table: standard]
MEDTHSRPRRHGSIFGCCFGADDSVGERSLLRPSWFQRSKRSLSIGDWAAVAESEGNWWQKGWTSVRQAGEWTESMIDDAGSCCGGRAKWKHFLRRFKKDGKTICQSRPARFQYDPLSYALNFDQGPRSAAEYPYQDFSARFSAPIVKP